MLYYSNKAFLESRKSGTTWAHTWYKQQKVGRYCEHNSTICKGRFESKWLKIEELHHNKTHHTIWTRLLQELPQKMWAARQESGRNLVFRLSWPNLLLENIGFICDLAHFNCTHSTFTEPVKTACGFCMTLAINVREIKTKPNSWTFFF